MKRPKVLLRDQADYQPDQIAGRAAEIIEGIDLDVRGKTVFVKPSFVYPSRRSIARGIITQPEFVAGVVMSFREMGARRVLVGESSILGPSRVSFHAVGILPLIKGIAEPIYLDEVDQVEVDVRDPFVQGRFRVPKVWLDADVYVSLPKIKTNMFADITLSVKNNLGMLRQYDRLLYHDWRLHKKLADLFKVRPPDLVIADCVTAGEGQGPILADPVQLGLMVGGNNAVAADVVACHLAGFKPDEVEHLQLLIDAGYGPGDLDGIEIDRPDLLDRARPFRRPEVSLHDISPKLRVFQGTERYCPWGCAGMIRGLMDPYVQQAGGDGIRPMNVILGKPIESPPGDLDPNTTIVLGDCAAPHREMGQFVHGCCPRPLDVGMIIRRMQGPIKILEEEVSVSNLINIFKAYAGHRYWRMGKRLAGKPLQPIENHVTVGRMMRELAIEIGLRLKKE